MRGSSRKCRMKLAPLVFCTQCTGHVPPYAAKCFVVGGCQSRLLYTGSPRSRNLSISSIQRLDNFVAVSHRQCATRTKIVLYIDNDQCLFGIGFHHAFLASTRECYTAYSQSKSKVTANHERSGISAWSTRGSSQQGASKPPVTRTSRDASGAKMRRFGSQTKKACESHQELARLVNSRRRNDRRGG